MAKRGEPKHRPFSESEDHAAESPIRIVFCITELDPGGAERALTQLVLSLDRKFWDPYVICLGPRGHFAGILETSDVPVLCLNARGVRSLPRVLFQLTRELRRLRPSLVQTFLFHANLVGRIAARWAGIPVVVSGLRVAERQNFWHGKVDRWTNRLVTTNVCVSQGVAEFSKQVVGLDPAKLVVIPNSVDFETFANASPVDMSQFGIPAGSRVFLSVGRLDRQKGFDILIRAIALLDPLPVDVYFLIVGEGPESDSLHLLVSEARLTKTIRFSPRRNDIPCLLAASLALILPSRWEGMPNVVLEAMAAGLPVIATSVEGIAELVQHEVTGLVVSPEQPSELSSAINQLLSQPEFVAEAGRSAQVIVKKEFTTLGTASAYEKLYRQMLQLSTK